MRPLGLPWGTFAAFLVVAASIVTSILWAARCGGSGRTEPKEGRDE
jgi:hypothetical protein